MNVGVLAQQGVFGPGVIKHCPNLDLRNLLPRDGRVAGLTSRLEGAVVGVGMTIGTSAKRDPRVTQQLRIVCLRLVTLLTRDPRVRARQREARARVIKPRHGLPVVEVMAPRAVLAELALVRVLMTGEAVPREAQEAPVEIFHLDSRALGGRNARGIVALLTRQPGVLAFQDVTCLRVVEALQGGFPTNELEILSVVFGMAARAVFLRGLGIHDGGMVAAMRGEPLGDFCVAFKASEFLTASP